MSAFDLATHDDIASCRVEIAAEVRARLRARRPDLAVRLTMSPDIVASPTPDLEHDILQLAAAAGAGLPELFADHARWLRLALSSRGGGHEDLLVYLDELARAVMTAVRSRSTSAAAAGLAAARDASEGPAAPDSNCLGEGVEGGLGGAYLRSLLSGRRHEALAAVLSAAEDGVPVESLLLDVLQPAQHEVGRLWQCAHISVAEEHYCTAATQQAVSMLYPRVFGSERSSQSLISAAVPGNLHELGARMVADCFELAGWDTHHLGADTPLPDLVSLVGDRKPDVLALSASMVRDVPATVRVVRAIRADIACSGVAILVGGPPFAISPDLWRRCGADAGAADGRAAVLAGERLCSVTP